MNKAMFTFDRDAFLHNDALYMIAGVDEYVVAVLNSSLSWWFLKNICTDLQNGYLQAFKENLFQIPISYATTAQKAPIIERVQKILADPARPDVPKLEAEIDQMVYKLYDLTLDEIAVIDGSKSKQDNMRLK
jgi:adenine-specific DNA-methyltransferase